jgi:hypothetical protein
VKRPERGLHNYATGFARGFNARFRLNVLKLTSSVCAFERSRWRVGRFAFYAPHVMPQRNASNFGSRTSFSKYRKTNTLQMGEKIEFP